MKCLIYLRFLIDFLDFLDFLDFIDFLYLPPRDLVLECERDDGNGSNKSMLVSCLFVSPSFFCSLGRVSTIRLRICLISFS